MRFEKKEDVVITKEDIAQYIERIPPEPKAVRACVKYLQVGELGKAAKVAAEDPALSSYLRSLVNKPIYGFKNEVRDIAQIFSILGVSGSLQSVYNYLMNILSPDEWHFFAMNRRMFQDLQDELLVSWNKILEHLKVDDRNVQSAITLLPASIIVCEALFNDHKEDVELIRSTKDVDLNTILQRLSGYTLFDVCEMIAQKWEMPQLVAKIVKAASGTQQTEDAQAVEYGKWMHLLLFYVLSKPQFIEAGLNDFIEFHVEFVSDIYEEFTAIMEKAA